MYIILNTRRNSRSGISTGFGVYTVDEFIKKWNSGDSIGGTLRYLKLNETNERVLSTCDLKTFEEMFVVNGVCKLTYDQVDEKFNKTVQKEYGSLSKYKGYKRIPKKDLEIGAIYISDDDRKYVYLGKVTFDRYEYGHRKEDGYMVAEIDDESSFQLISSNYNNTIIYNKGIGYNVSFTKSPTGKSLLLIQEIE